MNSDFPRILALLRKERNISQKQAAADLGVAQALLSHYEKGKRECGLCFLVKAADYYNVSADYMLGRAASPDGSFISEGDIPDSAEMDKDARSAKNIAVTLAKKMVIGAVDVIFSLLAKADNPKLTAAVTEFFTLTVYSCFRLTHRANPKNNGNIFGVSEETALRGASASRIVCEGKAVVAADMQNKGQNKDIPLITAVSLEADYGKQAVALMSLVKNSEKIINN